MGDAGRDDLFLEDVEACLVDDVTSTNPDMHDIIILHSYAL